MSAIDNLFDQIVKKEVKEGFIPATDKKNQHSLTVSAHNLRKKMPEFLRKKIGISKITVNGKYYVKVYKMEEEFLVLDENGNFSPFVPKVEEDLELQRILFLMEKDGVGEEEIEEFKNNWRRKQKR